MSALWIGLALDQLRSNISAGNQRGNVEGLLARHLIDDSTLGLQWNVDCDETWMQTAFDPSQLGCVAAVAYTLQHNGGSIWRDELESGLLRASARDPTTAGPGAALHDPAVLIGLCLGARLLSGSSPQYSTWCASVIRSLTMIHAGRRLDPMWAYAAELCGTPVSPLRVDVNAPLAHRAALDWWFRQPNHRHLETTASLTALRQSVVGQALSEPLMQVPAHQAGLLWRSLKAAVAEATTAGLQTPFTIAGVLRKFEAAMKRWRWDAPDLKQPIRWQISGEREVQDALWMILRPICPDLEDEDALPKFGHSSYKADFGVPSLGLLIEVKFARKAEDFKAIEKEILEDLVPYLIDPHRYREVLVFIYDDSCSVQNHETTIRALKAVTGISDVVIACRPSQLPMVTMQTRGAAAP